MTRNACRPLGIALLIAAPAAAGDVDLTAFVNTTTNFVYRAYTKSDDHWAVQANLDLLRPGGWFAGTWLSYVDFGGARFEANPYGGKRWHLGDDWRVETIVAAYIYDAPVFARTAHYGEVQASLHYRDALTLRAAVAPDAYGRDAAIYNLQLEGRYPLTGSIDLSASVGVDRARDSLDYDDAYWDVGMRWFPARFVCADLRYHDAETFNGRTENSVGDPGDGFEGIRIDSSVVLTLSLGF